jgi:hypothetical protein
MSNTLVNDGTVATEDTVETWWQGGPGFFVAESSNWGGGSVTLQWRTPNGTYITVGSAAVLSANGCVAVNLPRGCVKALVSGTPADFFVYLMETDFD